MATANNKITFWTSVLIVIIIILGVLIYACWPGANRYEHTNDVNQSAAHILNQLPVRELDSDLTYDRKAFGNGWQKWRACNTRARILQRDMTNFTTDGCKVVRGELNDLYTGKHFAFSNSTEISRNVQIDHVVALGNAWRTGAKYLNVQQRAKLANDTLELLAVSAKSNIQKSDSDASSWLPRNLKFRCSYIARQIAVKFKYHLWVTPQEKSIMQKVLQHCPGQAVPQH